MWFCEQTMGQPNLKEKANNSSAWVITHSISLHIYYDYFLQDLKPPTFLKQLQYY